jgi:hypothetical protein
MTVERGLHDSSLHAATPAMNQTDFLEPCPGSGGYVLVDHGRDIAGRKGMKIKFGVDGNFMHNEISDCRFQIADLLQINLK